MVIPQPVSREEQMKRMEKEKGRNGMERGENGMDKGGDPNSQLKFRGYAFEHDASIIRTARAGLAYRAFVLNNEFDYGYIWAIVQQ